MGIACETPSNGSVGTSMRRSGSTGRSMPAIAATSRAQAPAAFTMVLALTGPREVSSSKPFVPPRRISVTSVERHSFRAAFAGDGSEADHHAVGIDKAVGRAEAAAQYVIGAQLRHALNDLVARHHADLVQPERLLQRLIGPQIFEMCRLGRHEHDIPADDTRRAGPAALRTRRRKEWSTATSECWAWSRTARALRPCFCPSILYPGATHARRSVRRGNLLLSDARRCLRLRFRRR